MKSKLRNKFVSEKLKMYSMKQSKELVIGFVFSFLRTSMEILGPIVIGYVLNEFVAKNNISGNFLTIIKYLAFYLVIYVACGIFSNLSMIYFELAANNVTYFVQNDIYKHINELPIEYFDNLAAGSIVSRITNDTMRLKIMFQLILADIATAAIMIIAIYIMMVVTNIEVSLMLLILFPLVFLIFYDYRYKSAKHNKRIRHLVSKINANINENINNMEIIQALNVKKTIKDKFDKINKEIFSNNLALTKLRSYGGYRAIDIIGLLSTVIILFYFGYGHITKNYPVTVGGLYIIIDYTSKIFSNVSVIVTRFGDMEQAYASASHIFDIMKLDTIEKSDGVIDKLEGNIEFKNVYFAYDKNDVLKNVSFKIPKSTSAAFVGTTGSGKSTILNLILKFYDVKSGEILVDGVNINDLNEDVLREDFAVVLQDPFLFETTLKENITLDKDYSDEEVINALEELGCYTLLKKGLNEQIKEKGSNLSQGERQLISFARAYIRNPRVLILDEATSNIDTETEQIIQQPLEKLKYSRTTLIVAHRLSTIRNVDKIFALSNGKIIESGTHDELLEKDGFYKQMYDEQSAN
ncbi:MAG: ABC transporter ATP-binding protein [Finegoldia magna]|uniref:ABC transporter, ATP-binding protein n=3 Tax=Finegoldia magna TaxID=1260 RepID=E1KW29_FINMA|nr:ABC transporter ATP-binding protein [Finegoldia magna]EFL54688.1 ABC transporter, ATP-binding protein [Finegoldia magna BVS033A4]EXF26965.1 multidrug ABC transporter [Finegoldia magna ALB8]MDU5186021.1 ABC transporter ATP-binding protein [Finegoldia magna]MDU5742995.1 ABC transporter ATP-binding protein [Finegoldia magna]MDU5921811.1 ABC transporter ATP-binding protein [Finegoldia magna]